MNATISIETVNHNGESMYLVGTMDASRVKELLYSPKLKDSLAKYNLEFTGDVYISEKPVNQPTSWYNELPPDSRLFFRTTEFDLLAEKYFEHNEALKSLEKEFTKILNSLPNYLFKGEEYGGYNDFTSSTSLAYAKLYDMLKQKVASRLGKVGESILSEMLAEETKMTTPHKSSAKSLKIFRLGAKNEFANIWKE